MAQVFSGNNARFGRNARGREYENGAEPLNAEWEPLNAAWEPLNAE